MERYRDLETLLANCNHKELYEEINDIFMNEAAENADGFDGYEDACENDDEEDFIFQISQDSRMSQIMCEALTCYFNDELETKGQLHPETNRLYDWFMSY